MPPSLLEDALELRYSRGITCRSRAEEAIARQMDGGQLQIAAVERGVMEVLLRCHHRR